MIMTDPSFLFPEIWFRDVSAQVERPMEEGVAYATGFATANFAKLICTMDEKEVYRKMVQQLDTVFALLGPEHYLDGVVESLPLPSSVYLAGKMQ